MSESKIKVGTDNAIYLDGKDTGLKVTQSAKGTIVYTPELAFKGQQYREHTMPQSRYSTSHPAPGSGVAGAVEFENDIRTLLANLR